MISLNKKSFFKIFFFFYKKWRPNDTAPKLYVAQTLRLPIGGAQTEAPNRQRPIGGAKTAVPKWPCSKKLWKWGRLSNYPIQQKTPINCPLPIQHNLGNEMMKVGNSMTCISQKSIVHRAWSLNNFPWNLIYLNTRRLCWVNSDKMEKGNENEMRIFIALSRIFMSCSFYLDNTFLCNFACFLLFCYLFFGDWIYLYNCTLHTTILS